MGCFTPLQSGAKTLFGDQKLLFGLFCFLRVKARCPPGVCWRVYFSLFWGGSFWVTLHFSTPSPPSPYQGSNRGYHSKAGRFITPGRGTGAKTGGCRSQKGGRTGTTLKPNLLKLTRFSRGHFTFGGYFVAFSVAQSERPAFRQDGRSSPFF